jgi:hypothetical protein
LHRGNPSLPSPRQPSRRRRGRKRNPKHRGSHPLPSNGSSHSSHSSPGERRTRHNRHGGNRANHRRLPFPECKKRPGRPQCRRRQRSGKLRSVLPMHQPQRPKRAQMHRNQIHRKPQGLRPCPISPPLNAKSAMSATNARAPQPARKHLSNRQCLHPCDKRDGPCHRHRSRARPQTNGQLHLVQRRVDLRVPHLLFRPHRVHPMRNRKQRAKYRQLRRRRRRQPAPHPANQRHLLRRPLQAMCQHRAGLQPHPTRQPSSPT